MSNQTGRQRTEQPEPGRRSPLPLLAAFGGLAVLIAGVVWALLAGQPSLVPGGAGRVATSPQLVTDRTEIDFGQVPVNKMVRAVFKLTNAGDQPLKIVGEPRVEVAKGC